MIRNLMLIGKVIAYVFVLGIIFTQHQSLLINIFNNNWWYLAIFVAGIIAIDISAYFFGREDGVDEGINLAIEENLPDNIKNKLETFFLEEQMKNIDPNEKKDEDIKDDNIEQNTNDDNEDDNKGEKK